MAIAIDGTGTITGISVGGLNDSIITSAELANAAVTAAKIGYAGAILQVVSTTKTDTTSTTSTTATDITGLSAAITPTSASSKILITVAINLSQGYWYNRIYLTISGGNTASYIGDANTGVENAVTVVPRIGDAYAQLPVIMHYLDAPSTTSPITYRVRWWVESGTAWLNRPNTLDSLGGNCASTITVMEVAG